MSLRGRLFLAFGGLTLLVLAPALFAVSKLRDVRNIAFEQQKRHASALEALGQFQADLAEFDRFERSYVATPGNALQKGMFLSLDSARLHLSRIATAGYDSVTRPVASDLDSLAVQAEIIRELVQGGEFDSASALLEKAKPEVRVTQDALAPVADAIDEESHREVQLAQTITQSATTGTIVVGVMAFLLSLLIAAMNVRTLTGPLRRLRDATREVAGGHFDVDAPLPYDRFDEIGDVSRSFRSMTRRLAELERLKAEFLSVASHELKTPINVIAGYVGLLTEGIYGALTEEQKDILGRVNEQTVSLTRQVNDLLDISRIEAGGLALQVSSIDVADIMAALHRTFEPLAEQKRIHFTARVEDDAPHSVTADPDRLRNELLGNLLSNAFKFTPEGGHITVTARAGAGGRVRIDVSDTGVGIPPDQLPYIFDKYYQVGSEARRKGSGLGLAIAKEIAQAHGGDLTAESEVGQGTTFHIDLPGAPSTDGAGP